MSEDLHFASDVHLYIQNWKLSWNYKNTTYITEGSVLRMFNSLAHRHVRVHVRKQKALVSFRVGVLACHHHVTLWKGSYHQLYVFLLILTWMGSCHDHEDGRPCLVCFHCTSVMDLAREHRNGVSHIIIYARGGCGTAASTISIWQQIFSIHT